MIWAVAAFILGAVIGAVVTNVLMSRMISREMEALVDEINGTISNLS